MTINYITISNFKSHQDTSIDFHPGFNVIVGESTSGKTPVLQAIELVATNRPLGYGYKNIFAPKKDPVEITIGFEDTAITFFKDTNGAKYTAVSLNELDAHENKAQEFSSFGTNVPDAILDLVSLPSDNFRHGSSSRSVLNSPTEFSDIINRVTGAEEARLVAKNIKRMISANTKEQEFLVDRMKEARQKIAQCQQVRSIKPLLMSAKRVISKVDVCDDKISDLEDVITLNECLSDVQKHIKSIKVIQSQIEPLLQIEIVQSKGQKLKRFIDLKFRAIPYTPSSEALVNL
jgi:exonuclease SbcC